MSEPEYHFEVGIYGGNATKAMTTFTVDHSIGVQYFNATSSRENGMWMEFIDGTGAPVFMVQLAAVAYIRRGELVDRQVDEPGPAAVNEPAEAVAA